MNLQTACPKQNDQTCKVSCQDPTTPNQCVVLDNLLIDGSPCGPFTLFLCSVPPPEANCNSLTGYSGACQNGTCLNGNLLDTAKVIRFLSRRDSGQSPTNTLFFPLGLGQAWYVQNLQYSIPITVAAALLALTILWGAISKFTPLVDVQTGVDWASYYRLLLS